jgi:hypothetical protein
VDESRSEILEAVSPQLQAALRDLVTASAGVTTILQRLAAGETVHADEIRLARSAELVAMTNYIGHRVVELLIDAEDARKQQ